MSGAPDVLTGFFFTVIVLLTGSGFDDCAGVKPAIVLGPTLSKRDATFAAVGCFDFPNLVLNCSTSAANSFTYSGRDAAMAALDGLPLPLTTPPTGFVAARRFARSIAVISGFVTFAKYCPAW